MLKNTLHPFSSQTAQTLTSNIAFLKVNLYSAENIYFLVKNIDSQMKKAYFIIPIICSLYLVFPLIQAKFSEISISETTFLYHEPTNTTTNTIQYSLPVYNVGSIIFYEYRTPGYLFSVDFYYDGRIKEAGADHGFGTIFIPEFKRLINLTFINTDHSKNGWIHVEIEKTTDLRYIYNLTYFLSLIEVVVIIIITGIFVAIFNKYS